MGRKDKSLSPTTEDTLLPPGQQMRQARQNKKVSLSQLALRLGYSTSYLSGVENGHVKPSSTLKEEYERELDFTIQEQHNSASPRRGLEELSGQQPSLSLLRQGIQVWNRWREECPDEQPLLAGADLSALDLRGINLSHSILYSANISKADLRQANLVEADLTKADLSEAVLQEANLQEANLYKADLSEANLAEANLTQSDLRQTKLIRTILSKASLRGASLGGTYISNVDLSQVENLAELRHLAPSHVVLHTIQLPKDGSSIRFLRDSGVSDLWIENYEALMTPPVIYHSVFLSYASQDGEIARRLHNDLQDHGIRCWFAPEDMKIGDHYHQRIDTAIHMQEKVLLPISEHAVNSAWVRYEVEATLGREMREQREILFPIMLDDAVLTSTSHWAAKLRRTRHIGNFRNWKDPQAYQQALEKLIWSLRIT